MAVMDDLKFILDTLERNNEVEALFEVIYKALHTLHDHTAYKWVEGLEGPRPAYTVRGFNLMKGGETYQLQIHLIPTGYAGATRQDIDIINSIPLFFHRGFTKLFFINELRKEDNITTDEFRIVVLNLLSNVGYYLRFDIAQMPKTWEVLRNEFVFGVAQYSIKQPDYSLGHKFMTRGGRLPGAGESYRARGN